MSRTEAPETHTHHQPTLEFVDTLDRWKLPLYHYAPAKKHRSSKKYPVLLIHGFGTNHYNMDFPDPHYSLAKYLHRNGYDVWVAELRGAGKSHPQGLLHQCMAKLKPGWDYDDYVYGDLPAIVATIQRKTKRKKLHWAGHSLGGTLVYSAIETLGNDVCASATTLGSAMSASAKIGFIKLLLSFDPLIKKMPFLPAKRLAQLSSPLGRWIAPLENNFYYAIDNVDLNIMRLGMRHAVEDISTPLFLQIHDWYKNNHFRSRDNSFSYRDNLKKIQSPFLICAGSVDGLTPIPDVIYAYHQIRSKKKAFIVFGKEYGCRTEYGHIDLLLGKNAPHDVYPAIGHWMDENDG